MSRLYRLLSLIVVFMLAAACVPGNLNLEESALESTELPFTAPLPSTVLSTQEGATHTSSPLKFTPTAFPTPTVSHIQQPSSNSEQYTIELKVGTFDPLVNPLPIPDVLTLNDYPDEEGYYIIQFDGPIQDEWQNALDSTGAKRIGYIPNYAYLIRTTDGQKEKVSKLPHLRWIGLYQPGYKISPDLFKQSEDRPKLTVLTFPETGIHAIETKIIEWGGVIEDISENQYSGTILADFDMKYIVELARLPGVMWIEPWSRPGLP